VVVVGAAWHDGQARQKLGCFASSSNSPVPMVLRDPLWIYPSNQNRHQETYYTPPLARRPFYSSDNRSNKWILKIITNNPIVTIINKLNPNHPSTMAAVPTPLFKLPFPKSCATCAAAIDAVCCHSTLTSTKMLAMNIRAKAIWDTGREGKGLMSMSLPVRASSSSCQPGKVARRRKVTKARMMAMMLLISPVSPLMGWW